ncbi:MAG: molybdenum cofactor guanylyltransferase [Nitrospinota bacterium]|nr:molybdenum cofactor guanylyltransferase [Nitrospinota bacterium]
MIAAVLAGGASRRFGGGEKGLALFRGKPMVAWALEAAVAADSVVIIANNPELYLGSGHPVFTDVIKGMGPLSGLHAAFHHTGADEIFLLACDMPLASPAMVDFVIRRSVGVSGDAVIPLTAAREQGLFAVYRKNAVEKHLDRIKAVSIQFDEFRGAIEKTLIGEDELRQVEPELESFINVNSKADLARLERG